jgi:hypothetical protein
VTTLESLHAVPAALSVRLTRVNARAAAVDWRRALLVALMLLPFGLFFAARLIVRAVGWVLAWLWAAGIEGWEAAGPKREGAG